MRNSSRNWTFDEGSFNCPENRTVFILCAVVFIVTFISAVGGNSLVIGAIAKFRRLRKRNVNFLIGSLAVSNLLIAGLAPFEILRLSYPGTSRKLVCCLLNFAMSVTLMNIAGGNFLILTFERFVAVIFPFRHRTLLTRRRLKIMIAMIWIFSAVFACLPLFGWNNSASIGLTTELQTCSIDAVLPLSYQKLLICFGVTYVIANFIMFVPVILVAFKSSRSVGKHHYASKNTGLTKLLAYTFTTFCVSWCPFYIATIIVLLHKGPYVNCAHHWSMKVGMIHSAFDWMIYGFGNRSFRNAFKQIILHRSSGRLELST